MSEKMLTVRFWFEDDDEDAERSFEIERKRLEFDPNDPRADILEKRAVGILAREIYARDTENLLSKEPDEWIEAERDDECRCEDEPEPESVGWDSALKYGIDFELKLCGRCCASPSYGPDEPHYFGSFDEDGRWDYDYDVVETYRNTVSISVYDGKKKLDKKEDFFSCPLKAEEKGGK